MLLLPWSSLFEDPIPLPLGRSLVTLKDAADYITKLPKAEQNKPAWQIAIHCLIEAAEGRDFLLHARIGVLRALNADKPREFTERPPLGQAQAEERPMTVFVYVNTSKQVGDPEHIKVFATTDAAENMV